MNSRADWEVVEQPAPSEWEVVDKQSANKVPTFLGGMAKPNINEMIKDPKMIENLIGGLAGGQGMKTVSTALDKVPFKAIGETLFKKIDAKGLARNAQQSHDSLLKEAKDIFSNVRSEVANRKVANVGFPQGYDKALKKYLPSTTENKELIKKAASGDFNSIRDLQSLLGKEGASYMGSKLPTERKIGQEILDLRRQINSSVENHLNTSGHADLAKDIKKANDMYSKLHETYYSQPTIRAMVDKSKGRIIPKNPMNSFSEESDRIRAFHKAHPEIKDAVNLHERKKSITGMLGIPGVKTASALVGGDALIRYLLGR